MAARLASHTAVLIAFGALAVVYSWPIAGHFATHYIGPGGDAPLFVWNLWYFRHAVDVLHSNPLWTDHVYWPYGANMIQQHYSLSHDLIAYFIQGKIGLPSTYNALVLMNYVLAGYGVWLMARDWGADAASAFAAGTLYAFSPATSYSLFGGLGLDNQSVHVLPFFVWTLARSARDGRLTDAVLCALTLTWVWSCNLYYFLFCLLLIPLFFIALNRPIRLAIERREEGAASRAACRVLEAGLFIAGVLVLRALGRQTDFHGRGTLREAFAYAAPYLIFWALLAARLAVVWVPRARFEREHATVDRVKPYLAILACWTAMNWPMIAASLWFMTTPDYATAPAPLRGGGNPVDPLWLFVNYPHQFLWGSSLQTFLARLPLGAPTVAGLGLTPLAAAAWLWRRKPRDGWARLWFAGAAFSFAITLGPWLKLFGLRLYLPLPFYFLHLLPAYNNLQHGLQFTKFIMLFMALLFAAALSEYRRRFPRAKAALAASLAFGLVALECFPRAVPMHAADVPPVLARLGARPDGAMLPVPMGAVFNGLTAQGTLGRMSVLASDQAAHHKPIVGGYLGRASPRVMELMSNDPVLSDMIRAQNGGAVPPRLLDRTLISRWRRQLRLRYVLVQDSQTPRSLHDAISRRWPVRALDREGALALYEFIEP